MDITPQYKPTSQNKLPVLWVFGSNHPSLSILNASHKRQTFHACNHAASKERHSARDKLSMSFAAKSHILALTFCLISNMEGSVTENLLKRCLCKMKRKGEVTPRDQQVVTIPSQRPAPCCRAPAEIPLISHQYPRLPPGLSMQRK